VWFALAAHEKEIAEEEPAHNVTVPLSFNIPLASALAAEKVHYIDEAGKEQPGEKTPTACLGTAAAPKATSGNLCVYTKSAKPTKPEAAFIGDPSSAPIGPFKLPASGAATSGATLLFIAYAGSAYGTWAVTAP
jgi:hypothetical protein